jgi:hypothetical protein
MHQAQSGRCLHGLHSQFNPPHHIPPLQASQLNNLSAVVAMARLLDASDGASEALRHWRRAAKLGDAEGQLRTGLAAYHGSSGVAQDPEAAAMWLGKALKQVGPGTEGPVGVLRARQVRACWRPHVCVRPPARGSELTQTRVSSRTVTSA